MHQTTNRRRTAAGLASMALGAVAVVAGLAAPAAAHGSKSEPWKPPIDNATCEDLAEAVDTDAEWTQSKVDSGTLPSAGESERYELVDGELSAGYTGDGPWVEVEMNDAGNNFAWRSSVGIDAVYVKGGHGSTFYGYQPETGSHGDYEELEILGPGAEVTEDRDLGTLPYHDGPEISHITFCWDGEGSGTTSTTETPPSTDCPDTSISSRDENPPYEETPPTSDCDTPGSTTSTTTPPSTDAPTTTLPIDTETTTTVVENSVVPNETTTTVEITPEGTLPNTGSSSTTPLIVGGLALLALGGGLVAGKRWLRRA